MTQYPAAPGRKLSISSLLSFICGLLGCVPFVMGGLAVLLGIIGFVRTGNTGKRGRWMAVLGIVLGVISLGGWTLFGGGIYAIIKGTEGPRVATHDFMRDLSAGDMAGARAHSSGMSDEELQSLAETERGMGGFIDSTFNSTNIRNSDGSVSGTADFKDGTMQAEARLVYSGGAWKVTNLQLHK
jgi:hypothetical protein